MLFSLTARSSGLFDLLFNVSFTISLWSRLEITSLLNPSFTISVNEFLHRVESVDGCTFCLLPKCVEEGVDGPYSLILPAGADLLEESGPHLALRESEEYREMNDIIPPPLTLR